MNISFSACGFIMKELYVTNFATPMRNYMHTKMWASIIHHLCVMIEWCEIEVYPHIQIKSFSIENMLKFRHFTILFNDTKNQQRSKSINKFNMWNENEKSTTNQIVKNRRKSLSLKLQLDAFTSRHKRPFQCPSAIDSLCTMYILSNKNSWVDIPRLDACKRNLMK